MNGYFQIINNDKGTCLRLVPPTEGGEKIDIEGDGRVSHGE